MIDRRRASPGYTYEPCHGCGSTQHRPKATLCSECNRLMETARRRKKELEAAGDDSPKPFLMKERSYALPYLSAANNEPLEKAFFELGQVLSEPTNESPPFDPPDDEHAYPHVHERWSLWPFKRHGARSAGDWKCVRAMRPSHAAAVKALFSAVSEALVETHQKGHREGRNLLNQLASGEITMDKFNEVTLREEGKGS